MNILRRGKFGAALLFALIFLAVVGGMSWATLASVRLAEENIKSERFTKIDRALKGIEQYVAFVLSTETTRPYTDYQATFYEDPIAARFKGGRQQNLDPNQVDIEVASPLLPRDPPEKWRRFDWIDVYFQIDGHGRISSPQFPEDAEHIPFYAEPDLRTWLVWKSFRKMLLTYSLAEKAIQARERELLKDYCEEDADAGGIGAESQKISGGLLNAQSGYVPASRCIDSSVISQNTAPREESLPTHLGEGSSIVATKLIAPPFWLDPFAKLAFIREVHIDAEVWLQGFIADWELLKPHLLGQIQSVFPRAELFPEIGGWPNELAPNEFKVPLLPLIMRVPDFEAGASTEAWRSMRGKLLICWLGALTVLLIAGWGVQNLVALTERRMQFAYAVTHELRTPLTTFRLYSDMLSAGLVPEDRKQEYLDTLNRESARLSTMVESVLEYARLENRHARLHMRETDGPTLLNTVGETLDKRCEENGVEGRKINEIKNGLRIRTDVDLVSQITGVLINNACRHALGGKQPAVLLRLAGENGKVTVDVADSGPGVDRADSRRIFKPFRRGRDADKAARGGIGLGLSLARNWASLLGGRLDLVHRHDPEMGGARFRLTIPSQTNEV